MAHFSKYIAGSLCLWTLTLSAVLPENLEAGEIAVIKSSNIGAYNQAVAGFKESSQTAYREYDLNGEPARSAQVVEDIKRRACDLVVTVGSLAASVAAKSLSADLPVICALVLNTEAGELSGKNIFTISMEITPEAQLDILRSLLPQVKTVGMFYSDSTDGPMSRIKDACGRMGVTLLHKKLAGHGDVPQATEYMLPRVDALWLIADTKVVSRESLQYLLLVTLENKVPFMVYAPNFVKMGALVSMSVDFNRIGQQAGRLAQKILQGHRPSASLIPPEETDISLNLNTARRLEITVPQNVLKAARYVYE